MKKLVLPFFITALFFGCDKEKNNDKEPVICPPMACTEVFMSVTVKFVDPLGNPVVLKNYSSVNLRTKDTLAQNAIDPINSKGFYLVANDNHTRKLSEKGDSILVKGTHPTSNQTIQGTLVVAGGKCACHIEKISGPAELKFN